jgi:DNA-binding SARP family transcriptional activator/tetratricopeptide (TPR) repeat protein
MMAKSVEFQVLGPVQALVVGRPADVGERKQRLVLAVLALEVNKVVPVSRLAEMLWDGSPPQSARRIIQAHISRLRTALDGAGAPADGTALVRRGSGYLLAADPACVDAHRFRFLVEDARVDADDLSKVTVLRHALALWKGPALADAAHDEVRQRLCGGLEEMRLMALENLLEAKLRLGQHMEIIDELTDLTAQHPYRPRLIQPLMLALYRAGRTADALSAFQLLRDRLRGGMGLDPPAELVELHVAILRDDPGLSPGQARYANPSPAQLPGDIGDFVGRAADLAALSRLVPRRGGRDDASPAVIAVTGGAGVGKTALAVRWAHLAAAEFPDGQLYVNLQGYSATAPVTSLDALIALLHGIGVPTARIPADERLAAAMYRSEMSTRRMIVVLDNARSSEHVRALLPGRSRSVTLVTSRTGLTGLTAREGAARISLLPLSESEALTLLAGMVGADRVRDEAASAAVLAERCACLPLALRIAAARLVAFPNTSIGDYVKELAEEDGFAALEIDDDESSGVWAAFDHSYLALDPPARRAFRLLGALGSGNLPVPAIAAMNGAAPGQIRRTLGRLADAHLIERHPGARFGLHDLLRRYASVKSKAEDTTAEQQAALQRLIRWYLSGADRAVRLYSPFAVRRLPPVPAAGHDPEFSGIDEAVAWLEAELPQMVAAVVRAAADADAGGEILLLATRLARLLHPFLFRRGHLSSDIQVSNAALAAATRARDQDAEAWACLTLGAASQFLGQDDQVLTCLERALSIARTAGSNELLAACMDIAIDRWQRRGEVSRCEAALHEAMTLWLGLGDRYAVAFCQLNLGEVYRDQGLYQRARASFEESLRTLREVGDRYGEALVLHGLGFLDARQEQLVTAARSLGEAIDILKEIANRSALAHMLGDLGRLHRLRGAREEATSCLYEGLRLCRELGMRHREAVCLRELSIALDEIVPEQAENYRQQSLAILAELRATGAAT